MSFYNKPRAYEIYSKIYFIEEDRGNKKAKKKQENMISYLQEHKNLSNKFSWICCGDQVLDPQGMTLHFKLVRYIL